MDPIILWLTGAIVGLAGFAGWLVKTYITHLESDLAYSRKGHERGTVTTEKAVAVMAEHGEAE